MITTILAALAIHRIWSYEEIARPFRQRLGQFKPLTCPACFAFWAGLLAYLLPEPLQAILALYVPTRLAVFVYQYPLPTWPHFRPPPYLPPPHPPTTTTTVPFKATVPGRRTIILTTFGDFDSGYSLANVVLDHYRALLKIRPVELWVNSNCALDQFPKDLPPPRLMVPALNWKEDEIDQTQLPVLDQFLRTQIPQDADVIAHDLVFLSWFNTFAEALHRFPLPQGTRWWNVCHSSPGLRVDLPRTNLPPGHRLIALAPSLKGPFARYYACPVDRIDVVPNPRDLPTIRNFSAQGAALAAPVLTADVVQVYPLSAPRAESKGVRTVLKCFGALHREGLVVRLILPLAHSTPEQIERIQQWTKDEGLGEQEVVILPGGLPRQVVQELQQVANVFIGATWAEASPLAIMEAAACGQLMILNDDVPSLKDVLAPDEALYVPFGTSGVCSDQAAEQTADLIIEHLNTPREKTRRAMLRRHSQEALTEHLQRVLG